MTKKNKYKFTDLSLQQQIQKGIEIRYIRRFRFSIDSEICKELHSYVKSIHYNTKQKKIVLNLYEVHVKDDVKFAFPQDYIAKLKTIKDSIVLVSYDAQGYILQKRNFIGLKLVSEKGMYNCTDDGLSTRVLEFSYEYDEEVETEKAEKTEKKI